MFKQILLVFLIITALTRQTPVVAGKVTETGDILLGGLFPIHQKGM